MNGRSKDLIINAGKNVYPQDLEAIVNEIEGVHAGRAVAFGVPDEKEGTELIAIIAEVQTDDPGRAQSDCLSLSGKQLLNKRPYPSRGFNSSNPNGYSKHPAAKLPVRPTGRSGCHHGKICSIIARSGRILSGVSFGSGSIKCFPRT